jgi:hypothetical protein
MCFGPLHVLKIFGLFRFSTLFPAAGLGPVILLLLALSFLQGHYSLQDGYQVIPLLQELSFLQGQCSLQDGYIQKKEPDLRFMLDRGNLVLSIRQRLGLRNQNQHPSFWRT